MVFPYIFMEPSERSNNGCLQVQIWSFPWVSHGPQADPASSAPVLAAKKLKAADAQRVVKFYAKERWGFGGFQKWMVYSG